MILEIRVSPKSSRNLIRKESGKLKAFLTNPAEDNLVNMQLIDLLSDYLDIKKRQIKIIKGFKSRDKLIKINE